jgi:hypothetical protein
MIRDRWLRGGLTVAVDHGSGVVTQYTHCAKPLAPLGAVLRRGDPVALSGAAGLDMVQFFPWIPPHVHFMVYVNGTPVDPFLAAGEAVHTGTWVRRNEPVPSGPLADDPSAPRPSDVDDVAIERAIDGCRDARIRAEIAACAGVKAHLAALIEDALVHDAWAWPGGTTLGGVRSRRGDFPPIALSLPLPGEAYAGARFADAPWTAPPS